jgi:hypothetical protein
MAPGISGVCPTSTMTRNFEASHCATGAACAGRFIERCCAHPGRTQPAIIRPAVATHTALRVNVIESIRLVSVRNLSTGRRAAQAKALQKRLEWGRFQPV